MGKIPIEINLFNEELELFCSEPPDFFDKTLCFYIAEQKSCWTASPLNC